MGMPPRREPGRLFYISRLAFSESNLTGSNVPFGYDNVEPIPERSAAKCQLKAGGF